MSKGQSTRHLLDFRDCGLVVVAAGAGTRFGGRKQVASILQKPLLVHTLEAFEGTNFERKIVVLPEDMIEEGTWEQLQGEHGRLAEFEAVAGREYRAWSVLEGLLALKGSCDFIAVHDGARPFPPIAAVQEAYSRLRKERQLIGVTVAVEVTDAIKRVDNKKQFIVRTEDRRMLVRAETPQLARVPQLARSLRDEANADAADEMEALERLGYTTGYVIHGQFNPKVTHRSDVPIAETYLRHKLDNLYDTE